MKQLNLFISIEDSNGKILSKRIIAPDFNKEYMEKMDEFFGMNKLNIMASILKDCLDREIGEEMIIKMINESKGE